MTMTRCRTKVATKASLFMMTMPLLLVMSTASCGPDPNRKTGDPSNLPSNEQAFGSSGTKCNAYRPPTEPDLIGWDSGSRGKLNNQRSYGVIVVRYVAKGCNVELEVLSNCIARTQEYKYHPYWSNESKVANNQEELFANLPIGAASLQGYIKDGESLRADLTSAGIVSIPPDATFSMADLKGADCGRATHVVTKVYLGAFAMAAGNAQTLRAQASVFGAGGGAGKTAVHSIGREEGDLTACKTAKADQKEHADCAVPLRITLLGVEGAQQSTEGEKTAAGTPSMTTTKPAALAGEWQIDGITLGKAVGAAMNRTPYTTQLCDDDPVDNGTRRVLFYGAKECRGKSFPEGSSVVVFTDSLTSDKLNEKISAIAWVGGAYFNATRTSFPLQVGEPASRAAEVLGPVQSTFYLKGLTVQKHARAYSLIDGSKIAGFVIGTMPPEGSKESWSAVSQVYLKYTERVDPAAAAARASVPPPSSAAAASPPPSPPAAVPVTIKENIFFETNKSTIAPASDAVLRGVADTINRNPTISVIVEGHTDNQEGGDTKAALKLSQERAQAVYLYLIKLGVSSNRLTVAGAGASKPVAVNNTMMGRAQNRRVQFSIWGSTTTTTRN